MRKMSTREGTCSRISVLLAVVDNYQFCVHLIENIHCRIDKN